MNVMDYDKSFINIDNFLKIYQYELSRGKIKRNDLEDEKTHEISDIRKNLKEKRAELKLYRKDKSNFNQEIYDEKFYDLNDIKKELQEKEKAVLIGKFNRICKAGLKTDDFVLFEDDNTEKYTFKSSNIETKLLCRSILLELEKYYKIPMSNRNDIIDELKVSLSNRMQMTLFITDIRHCFESIRYDKLLEKLESDGYLSDITLKFLKKILKICSYQLKKNGLEGENGIPRGLNFSSYLAEIYLADIDNKIKKTEGIYLYKRYVDDIVILCDDKFDLKNIKDIIIEKELLINENKTKQFALPSKELSSFKFLGYQFDIRDGLLDIKLSQDKMEKYKNQIDSIFSMYLTRRSFRKNKGEINRKIDPLKHLMIMLRVLTSNGYLSNWKSFVRVGIYYSNRQLTNFGQLHELDEYLETKINDPEAFSFPDNLFRFKDSEEKNIDLYNVCVEAIKKKILRKCSFYEGFTNRRMYKAYFQDGDKQYTYDRVLLDLKKISYFYGRFSPTKE